MSATGITGATGQEATTFFTRIGSRWSWMAMACLWSIYAMNTNMRQWVQILQPSLVEDFHLSPSAIGLYSGVLTMALGVSAIGLSPWVDRGGHGWARKYRHLPIVLCYLAFSVLTGIGALTSTFAAVFAFQLIKNFGSGIGEAVEVTAVAEWWPLERRGFAQGLHHTAFPWGSLIGGLMISLVFTLFGNHSWRLVFLLLPWVVLIPLALFWRFSTARNYALFVADTRARGLTPPLVDTADGATLHAAPGAFGRSLRNPNVLVAALASGFANFGYYGITFWLPLYLAFVAHYSLAKVAALSVLFTITGGLGQIVWGSISDRLGRKFSLILMFLWLTVAFLLFRYAGRQRGRPGRGAAVRRHGDQRRVSGAVRIVIGLERARRGGDRQRTEHGRADPGRLRHGGGGRHHPVGRRLLLAHRLRGRPVFPGGHHGADRRDAGAVHAGDGRPLHPSRPCAGQPRGVPPQRSHAVE